MSKLSDIQRRLGIRGRTSIFRVWDDGLVHPIGSKQNQIQVSWGHIAAMAIGLGRREYRVSGLYIEYENVVDPEDAITAPTYAATEGLEYYNDLALSSTRDYLRVPLIQAPMLGIETGYQDYFVDGESGNKLTFFAMSQGTTGVHGKAFSDSANSKVFGAALVAIPTFQDATKDVILARAYYDVADQTLKLASSQVGIAWDVTFGLEE